MVTLQSIKLSLDNFDEIVLMNWRWSGIKFNCLSFRPLQRIDHMTVKDTDRMPPEQRFDICFNKKWTKMERKWPWARLSDGPLVSSISFHNNDFFEEKIENGHSICGTLNSMSIYYNSIYSPRNFIFQIFDVLRKFKRSGFWRRKFWRN